MKRLFERIMTRFWNRIAARRLQRALATGLLLGNEIVDGMASGAKVMIPHARRATHIVLIGRTGTGKSSLIRKMCEQDVQAGRGFLVFDVHGELTPAILSTVAAEERRLDSDLSHKVVVLNPADTSYSVGLNPLDIKEGDDSFVRVSQVAELLKQRWGLHTFGARTEELLRNSLLVLAENGLTLLELDLLLTDAMFRASCLKNVTNAEIRAYFEVRYGAVSDAMQGVMREPILNKTSAFTADPHFRFIIGQRNSPFSIRKAMDEGQWVLVNLAKAKLGTEAITLGALIFAAVKHAAFERERRSLFTVLADEVQNLMASSPDLETLLAESRKQGVSICTANQYLEQLPLEVRAAILATGNLVCFQLSPPDAQFVANALDGGKTLAERLKNLPSRHLVVKSGSEPLVEAEVPTIHEPKAAWRDLYERSRVRWARPRAAIESDIASRRGHFGGSRSEALHEWD